MTDITNVTDGADIIKALVRVITMTVEKGGDGKTTDNYNTAAALALLGKKVLVVDLDPSAKLTKYAGVDPKSLEKSTYELVIGHAKPEEIVIHLPNGVDLLPANRNLEAAIEDFVLMREREGIVGELILAQQMQEFIKNYDYVFFDTMPTHSKLMDAALIASNEVFFVVAPEFFSVDGLSELIETVEEIQASYNPDLQITGAIISKLHGGFARHKGLSKHVKKSLGDIVFDTAIRTCSELADSTGHHQDIFQYKKNSRGAKDFMALAKEIIKQERKI
jgi:chromosome partitioning protein